MSDPCPCGPFRVRVVVPAEPAIVRVRVPAEPAVIRRVERGDIGATGADAYAVWLAAGHAGTRDDFLASLKGDPGADGPPAAPLRFEYRQISPAAVWTIAHNLGVRPSVTVLTAGGALMLAAVLHLSENTLQIVLDDPQVGLAICV